MSGLLPALAPKRFLRLAAVGAGAAAIVVAAWLAFEALWPATQPASSTPSPLIPTSTPTSGPLSSSILTPSSTLSDTATTTPTPTPTATASPSAPPPTLTRVPSTKTPTLIATTIPDTAGPSIKSVLDSPDPIKVTQPKGCTPTTSVVTAAISDPSGVAGADVLFFHTTIGALPMSNAGGNTWQATLGPYAAVGDGTVDYQVRATDSLGNVSESAFSQITVLACIP